MDKINRDNSLSRDMGPLGAIATVVAGTLGAEVRNPGRNLPLAMAGGLLATASSVHAVMAAAIKMPYAWSWDGIFPSAFSAVSRRFRTPHWSLFMLYVVAAALTFWSGGLDKALSIATFSYLIAYLTVSCTAGYVYLMRPDLAARAAFRPGAWFYVPLVVAIVGSVALLTQAANWRALFTGDFGALSTLDVYVPWLVIGLVVFAIYAYRGQQQGADVDAILQTVPGVAADRA